MVAYNRLHDRLACVRKHAGDAPVATGDAMRLLAIEVCREKGARNDTITRLRQYIWFNENAKLETALMLVGIAL